MKRNHHNDTHSNCPSPELSMAAVELRPVDDAELAGISGGVGPVFDTSKVEGPRLPSWYLPVSPRLSIPTIR